MKLNTNQSYLHYHCTEQELEEGPQLQLHTTNQNPKYQEGKKEMLINLQDIVFSHNLGFAVQEIGCFFFLMQTFSYFDAYCSWEFFMVRLIIFRASNISRGRRPAKFRYFREIQRNSPKNTAKSARNISKYMSAKHI